MQRHAQLMYATSALEQAAAALPPTPTVAAGPPARAASPRAPANSNDMLPAARGAPTPPPPPPPRKRRRVRADGAAAAGEPPVESFRTPRPTARLEDVGGIDAVLAGVRELVEWPLRHMELYAHLGVDPPRGILLHGPPGCGKTLLAHAIAGELDVPLLRVSAPEIVSGMSGESERKVRGLFAEAVRLAPSIVFIDEIDTIASRREDASKEMGRRIVAQLLTCLDELGARTATQQNGDAGAPPQSPGPAPAPSVLSKDAALEDANLGPLDATDLTDGGDATDYGFGEDQAMTVEAKMPELEVEVEPSPSVIVIAATNRPEAIEPALRRAGRFDREIELGAPDDVARAAILRKMCSNIRLADSCDFDLLAKKTAGYVGADLQLLVKEAGVLCIRRFGSAQLLLGGPDADPVHKMSDEAKAGAGTTMKGAQNGACEGPLLQRRKRFCASELEGFAITMQDFLHALDKVQPSSLREGFATRPSVSWADVGALEEVREDLTMAVVEPIRVPERFAALGLASPAGVLLYGPPGCGKTLLARAVAAESGANFISVKGPELLSKYVGDSELAVRKLFHRARASAPCIVFFDELDALAPRRGGGPGSGGGGGGGDSGASERVVNMLLTEMDGFDVRKQVFLIAATNRPDIIDPAMLRPGRLDKLMYVPLPSESGRQSILKTLLKQVAVAPDVDPMQIASDKRCSGFSGADMHALIRAAGENAMRESLARNHDSSSGDVEQVRSKDFDVALRKVLPSVSPRDARLYRSLETSLRKSRAHLASTGDDANAGTAE